jgi:hypothetical protein
MNALIASKKFRQSLAKLAWKFLHRVEGQMELQDLVQIGNEAAIRAIPEYDPTRVGKSGKIASLSTFLLGKARTRMHKAVKIVLRRIRGAAYYRSEVPPEERDRISQVLDIETIFMRISEDEVELLC